MYKLSPSDLTFLWSECPRCFYLKVVRGMDRPRMAMPAIFTRIDRLMKEFFMDLPAAAISPGLPAGKMRLADSWVVSEPIVLSEDRACGYIRGKLDAVLEFADGSYGIVDFKTTEPKPEHVSFYSRQLHAYAYALEHPAPAKLSLSPIRRLGLLSMEPQGMDRGADGRVGYVGRLTWQEIPRDDGAFLDFLSQVLALLKQPEPPAGSADCPWCAYRQQARETGL